MGQEKLAQSPASVVEGRGGTFEIIASRQSYETVAEVFALKEKEDEENYNDGCRCIGRKKRPQHREDFSR